MRGPATISERAPSGEHGVANGTSDKAWVQFKEITLKKLANSPEEKKKK